MMTDSDRKPCFVNSLGLTPVPLIYEAGALAREVSYGYDGNGRRIWKRVDEKSGGGAYNVLKFIYHEDDAAAEFNGDGVMLANYLFAPGVDEPLMVDRAGKSYYYHQDNIHSVIFITDADGDVVNEYDYDSYGNILRTECPALNLSPPKPCVSNRFAYTGREHEPEIGMYHYRRRTYNPDAGIFTSEDKLIISSSYYSYVQNNPITFIDPSGLVACLGGCPWCGPVCWSLGENSHRCRQCRYNDCKCHASRIRIPEERESAVSYCETLNPNADDSDCLTREYNSCLSDRCGEIPAYCPTCSIQYPRNLCIEAERIDCDRYARAICGGGS